MSKELLERAQTLIMNYEFDEARAILESLQERSSTARRWLEQLDEVEAEAAQTEPTPSEYVAPIALADDLPIEVDASMVLRGDYISPDDAPTVVATESATALPDTDLRWEYREIILKTWQQHMSNVEYALSQGGEKITIEDAYTRMLNEHGAQGWEVVSEQMLPQQYVRVLFKRPVTGTADS